MCLYLYLYLCFCICIEDEGGGGERGGEEGDAEAAGDGEDWAGESGEEGVWKEVGWKERKCISLIL